MAYLNERMSATATKIQLNPVQCIPPMLKSDCRVQTTRKNIVVQSVKRSGFISRLTRAVKEPLSD